jgi:hypothetical protein
MPFGVLVCLPIGGRLPFWRVSVGSHTLTTSSFEPARSCGVTSKVNASYPPVWPPTWTPLTQTVVCQSTAPKLSWTRRPAHEAGTVNARR